MFLATLSMDPTITRGKNFLGILFSSLIHIFLSVACLCLFPWLVNFYLKEVVPLLARLHVMVYLPASHDVNLCWFDIWSSDKPRWSDVCRCIDPSHTSTPGLLNMAHIWPDVRLYEEACHRCVHFDLEMAVRVCLRDIYIFFLGGRGLRSACFFFFARVDDFKKNTDVDMGDRPWTSPWSERLDSASGSVWVSL